MLKTILVSLGVLGSASVAFGDTVVLYQNYISSPNVHLCQRYFSINVGSNNQSYAVLPPDAQSISYEVYSWQRVSGYPNTNNTYSSYLAVNGSSAGIAFQTTLSSGGNKGSLSFHGGYNSMYLYNGYETIRLNVRGGFYSRYACN